MTPTGRPLASFRRGCAICAAIGIAFSILCLATTPQLFFEAWLCGWFYWFSISVGCLGLLMIYRLAGGEWGRPLERIALSGARAFWLLFILFLPLLGGLHSLYPWAHPDVVQASHELRHKHAYLSIAPWIVRAAIYFAVWIALSRLMTGARKAMIRPVSAVGLVLVFLTVSFASVDWIMSLEPLWYSTIYGLIILTGQGLLGLAFSAIALHWLTIRFRGWKPSLTPKVHRDIGNLMLTASILWTYTSFVQWLIIWIGNEPETVAWYVPRATGAWSGIAWAIFIGQFLVPFQLLPWIPFKERTRNLAALGAFLMLMHLVEIAWLVEPALHASAFPLNWAIVPAMLAVGGLWLLAFAHELLEARPAHPESEQTLLLQEVLHAEL